MNRPEVYIKYNSLQKEGNEFTLDKYSTLIQWKKLPKILDLGSGDGKTTMEVLEPRLPRDHVKLIGSDLQEKMVKHANQLYSNNDRVNFVQFDVEGEKLIAGKYDHIFSFFALQFVHNYKRAFSNIYTLLEPGGDFLMNFVSYSPFFDLIYKLSTCPTWSPYVNKDITPIVHTIQKCKDKIHYIKTHVKQNKFRNVKINIEHRNYTYKNWDECTESYLAVDPILPKISNKQKNQYIVDFYNELKNVFEADLEKSDGKVTVPYDIIVVYASKPLDEQ